MRAEARGTPPEVTATTRSPLRCTAGITQLPDVGSPATSTNRRNRRASAAIRELICRFPDRFLFGSDLVTRDGLPREHYVSRYWCQRTLWESSWEGRSPIADPDYTPPDGGPATPELLGLGLPPDVLRQVYHDNAARLLPGPAGE